MERNYFTEEEMNELKENHFVKSITTKQISYTKEFMELFIKEINNGKGATRIFIENGFNPYILGSNRIQSFSKRIRKKEKEKLSFDDNRGKKSTGRPKKTTVIDNNNVANNAFASKDEEIEYLKHQNIMLKAENDLLKKMEFLVNQQELKKSQHKKDIN